MSASQQSQNDASFETEATAFLNEPEEAGQSYKRLKLTNVVENGEAVRQILTLKRVAEQLHETAEMEAWEQVESFAQEARDKRRQDVEIKRKHTERYFAEKIEEWEERLETYREQAKQRADMSAPIGNAKQKLEQLRRERNNELARLEEEQHVIPQEPELVTAAYILSPDYLHR